MSKYEPLYDHLCGLSESEWFASFADVEKVLGFSLPNSAYTYLQWWENRKENPHPQAFAWMNAGWKTTDVNMTGKTLTFIRGN